MPKFIAILRKTDKQSSPQSSSPGTSFLLLLLLQTGAWEETNVPALPPSLPLKTWSFHNTYMYVRPPATKPAPLTPLTEYHVFPRDFKMGFVEIRNSTSYHRRKLSLTKKKRQSFSAQPCFKHQQKKMLTCSVLIWGTALELYRL